MRCKKLPRRNQNRNNQLGNRGPRNHNEVISSVREPTINSLAINALIRSDLDTSNNVRQISKFSTIAPNADTTLGFAILPRSMLFKKKAGYRTFTWQPTWTTSRQRRYPRFFLTLLTIDFLSERYLFSVGITEGGGGHTPINTQFLSKFSKKCPKTAF